MAVDSLVSLKDQLPGQHVQVPSVPKFVQPGPGVQVRGGASALDEALVPISCILSLRSSSEFLQPIGCGATLTSLAMECILRAALRKHHSLLNTLRPPLPTLPSITPCEAVETSGDENTARQMPRCKLHFCTTGSIP